MSSDGYDAREVQTWINEIEEILETPVNELNKESEEVASRIRTHYIAAQQKIMDEGLSEEASYEIEVAHNLLSRFKYAENLNNEPYDI